MQLLIQWVQIFTLRTGRQSMLIRLEILHIWLPNYKSSSKLPPVSFPFPPDLSSCSSASFEFWVLPDIAQQSRFWILVGKDEKNLIRSLLMYNKWKEWWHEMFNKIARNWAINHLAEYKRQQVHPYLDVWVHDLTDFWFCHHTSSY